MVTFEELLEVLVGNDYFGIPFLTEHSFRLARSEASLRIYRTRPQYVRSPAHFAALMSGLRFPAHPPESGWVLAALRRYRPAAADPLELLAYFRALAEGYEIAAEDLDAVFRSLDAVREVVLLVDEWNERRAVFRTDAELIYLQWGTSA